MNTILRTSTIIFLALLVNIATAQHNMNQKQFKAKSSGSFNLSSIDKEDAGYYASQSIDYGMQNQSKYLQKLSSTPKDNEIYFESRALMNVKADRFLAVFNLTQIGESAAKVDELMHNRINSFVDGLKQMGLSDKDIYIDMIYMIPTFEFEVEKKLFSKTYNEVPTGFEMQKNVHITFNDINKVDDIVTLAAKCEIYDLVKVDYFVSNTEGIFDTLRTKAIENINKKVIAYKKLNLTLNDKFHIAREVTKTIYPETQYPDYDAFVSQSLEAVTKKTGVTKIRKPKTVAYDQIPYNDFDIIINPNILEPVVQYIYAIQLKYILDKPEEKAKVNYMLITPTGDVKKLDIQQ